jgi:hypothetical protein
VRGLIVDEIAARCEELHHIVELVGVLRPPLDSIEQLQSDLDERRRREAANDVKRSRSDYERRHGGIDQRALRQHWDETFDQRVAVRDAELRATLPWRHQDLAIDAHRQLRLTLARDLGDMIEHLTQPILGIGQKLVQMYDQLVTAPTGGQPVP